MQQLAPSPSLPSRPIPYGLWSLWDMLRFHAHKFVKALNLLGQLDGVLKDDPEFVFKETASVRRDFLARQVQQLMEQLLELQLPVSLKKAEQVRFILADAIVCDDKRSVTASLLNSHIGELRERIKDELESKAIYYLPANVEFLEAKTPLFGAEVDTRFRSAAYDIEEAGKCLALSRATACVMHLMRATEVALKALGTTVSVGQQNDWGAYIREIGKELSARAASAGRRTPDEAFYSEAASSFDHVRRAWRNPTMHIEKVYTLEQAADIFEATRSFMRHLATRISE